jgi:hypothetical protein
MSRSSPNTVRIRSISRLTATTVDAGEPGC